MRSLGHEARAERRKMVIKLRKDGATYKAIAEETGLSMTGVLDICKRYEHLGPNALKDAAKGRQHGEGLRLSAEQEAEIQELIADKMPDQLKMPYALWSRPAVSALIATRYDITLPVCTMGHYLKLWGFTPKKPIRRAYAQSPKAVQEWLDTTYPQIEREAKAEGAEILWGDETGLRSDDVRRRSFASRGKIPVVRINGRHEGLSIISAVSNNVQMRWKLFDGALNSDILVDFLRRLIERAGQKVFLILDNLRVHHSKPVKEWLVCNVDKIKVFYLPNYSPELNPDEMANADIKLAVNKLAPARTKAQLVKAATSHLRSVQKEPARVRSYFQHDPAKYAA